MWRIIFICVDQNSTDIAITIYSGDLEQECCVLVKFYCDGIRDAEESDKSEGSLIRPRITIFVEMPAVGNSAGTQTLSRRSAEFHGGAKDKG